MSLFYPVIFGSGGLTYETGTYTPTSHQTRPTISFSNNHSEPPIMVFIALDYGSSSTESRPYSLEIWSYVDVVSVNSLGYEHYLYNSDNCFSAFVSGAYIRETSTHGSWSGSTLDTSIAVRYGPSNSGDSSNAYSRYFVTENYFKPSCTNSYTSQVAAGCTYTWFAVWAPE